MRLVKPSYKFHSYLEYDIMLKNVCVAISNCYKATQPTTQKDREDFIRRRLKADHWTVIEHCGFTATFSVDRGITHELVRHRLASFTQESTRYCCYSNDKFDNQVTFVMPKYVSDEVPEGSNYMASLNTHIQAPKEAVQTFVKLVQGDNVRTVDNQKAQLWLLSQDQTEQAYLNMLQVVDCTPEEARGVLTNAVKADITITANMREWNHILELRYLGATGKPHPQMVEIMTPFAKECKERFPVFFENI